MSSYVAVSADLRQNACQNGSNVRGWFKGATLATALQGIQAQSGDRFDECTPNPCNTGIYRPYNGYECSCPPVGVLRYEEINSAISDPAKMEPHVWTCERVLRASACRF